VTDAITVGGRNFNDVAGFAYVGSILMCSDDAEAEAIHRIGKVASVFRHDGTNVDIVCDQRY